MGVVQYHHRITPVFASAKQNGLKQIGHPPTTRTVHVLLGTLHRNEIALNDLGATPEHSIRNHLQLHIIVLTQFDIDLGKFTNQTGSTPCFH
jgi:hypothetical protein